MKQSSALEVVKGRMYPGTTSKIVDIVKKGNVRLLRLSGGHSVEVSKSQLRTFVHATINERYRTAAFRSVRVTPEGVKATIGGPVRGERRTYSTPAAAKAAITRHYGK